MHNQSCIILVIFAGISILLTAPSRANLVGEVGVQGLVGVTGGGGGGLQGSVGVTASGGLSLPHIDQCLDVILAVPGCLNEIISSVLSFPPRLLGPQCCKVILRIHERCLPKLSVNTANFPFTLKNFCAARYGSPPPPPRCRKHHHCKKDDNED